MDLLKDSNYVSGLFDAASYNLLPSFTKVICIKKKDIALIVKDFFKVNEKHIEYEEYQNDLTSFIKDIFHLEGKELNNFIYYLNINFGNCKQILMGSEKLIDILDKNKYIPFYFLEDIYFLVFDKTIICLIIGNNE